MAGRGVLIRLHRLARRFIGDRQGVGAIEFAILFPILVMLYIGAFEITIGLSISKRASRAAGMITDVVTQQKSVTKAWLSRYALGGLGGVRPLRFDRPYGSRSRASLSMVLETRQWHGRGRRMAAVPMWRTPPPRCPTDMKKANMFLVRTELSIPYKLFLFAPNLVPNDSTITISRSYFYLPRASDTVTCGDC